MGRDRTDTRAVEAKTSSKSKKSAAADVGTLSILPATALALNQCMGTGWLANSFSLAQTGVVLGALLLVFFMLAANVSKNFLLEGAIRSEALCQQKENVTPIVEETHAISRVEKQDPIDEDEEYNDRKRSGSGETHDETLSKNVPMQEGPHFEITDRKFEMTDVSRVTLGMIPTIIFGVMYIFATYISLMAYTQVFSLALGTNIGPHLGFLGYDQECGLQASMTFGHHCWPAYAISVGIFGTIVFVLAILGFKETYWIQVGFTFIRIAVLLIMVITLLADTSMTNFPGVPAAAADAATLDDSSFYVNFSGMAVAIPILCYTFINLDTAPSVAQSMKPSLRHKIRGVYLNSYAILLFFYLLCALVVTTILTANGKEVTDSINLVWNSYGGPDAGAGSLIIRYLVVFLPALDVLSSFPIQTTALNGNTVALFFGQKLDIPPSGFSFRRIATFSVTVFIPVILGLFFTSISSSLDISGPMSIAFAYLYPVLFAWRGRDLSIAAFGRKAGEFTPFTNKYSRPWFYWISGVFFALLVVYLLLGLCAEYGVDSLAVIR